jgi:uncharacterized membrane protein (DUF373 family)
MSTHDKFDKGLMNINKGVLKFLMLVLTICIILGSIDLVRLIYKEISTETYKEVEHLRADGTLYKEIVVDSPIGFLNLKTMLETFNLILIIAVGYELVKSLHTLINSTIIPVLPLVQIAMIALANKMITVNFKEAGFEKLLAMSAIMLSLGATYFFLKKGNNYDKKNEEGSPPPGSH